VQSVLIPLLSAVILFSISLKTSSASITLTLPIFSLSQIYFIMVSVSYHIVILPYIDVCNIYVCICVYVCIYVCTYACMYMCMHIYEYVSMYGGLYVCTKECMYTWNNACMCVYMCVCTYVLIYAGEHICVNFHSSKHVCMNLCNRTSAYMYVRTYACHRLTHISLPDGSVTKHCFHNAVLSRPNFLQHVPSEPRQMHECAVESGASVGLSRDFFITRDIPRTQPFLCVYWIGRDKSIA
jgi:hypothetical protein